MRKLGITEALNQVTISEMSKLTDPEGKKSLAKDPEYKRAKANNNKYTDNFVGLTAYQTFAEVVASSTRRDIQKRTYRLKFKSVIYTAKQQL